MMNLLPGFDQEDYDLSTVGGQLAKHACRGHNIVSLQIDILGGVASRALCFESFHADPTKYII